MAVCDGLTDCVTSRQASPVLLQRSLANTQNRFLVPRKPDGVGWKYWQIKIRDRVYKKRSHLLPLPSKNNLKTMESHWFGVKRNIWHFKMTKVPKNFPFLRNCTKRSCLLVSNQSWSPCRKEASVGNFQIVKRNLAAFWPVINCLVITAVYLVHITISLDISILGKIAGGSLYGYQLRIMLILSQPQLNCRTTQSQP